MVLQTITNLADSDVGGVAVDELHSQAHSDAA